MRAVRIATWTGVLPRSFGWSWYFSMMLSLSILILRCLRERLSLIGKRAS